MAPADSHGHEPPTPLGAGLTRRGFLTAVSASVVVSACRFRRPYDARAFSLPERSIVTLLPAPSYAVDFADLVYRGLRESGADVMVEYEVGAPINTHPLVVAGAAVACRRAGAAQVVVGEAPGHRRDIEYLLATTGLGDQLRDHRIRFVDLNHDDVRIVPLKSSFTGLTELALPVELLQSDFIISMPKLKTHHWAGMTCSMKNLFGTVPGAVYGWPKNVLHQHGIPNSILDLTATVRPHFAIVDGVVAMEGDGPVMGSPRNLGFVAMGSDLVAVDATCARIIGLDPSKMDYIESASHFLGVMDAERIEQRGERPDRYATRLDIVSDLEYLR
jgi:uncharacterized protein (DUF362 family)